MNVIDSKGVAFMSILQTTDLKKYYGTEPNITHNNEIAQLAAHIVRIKGGKIVG